MVEWSITVVLKTTVPRGTGGSNPSLSAKNPRNLLKISRFFFFMQKLLPLIVRHLLRHFYATYGMLLLFNTILYHFPIAALVASYAANDTIFAQSLNTFFHCTRGHPKLHGNFSRSNFGI